MTKEELCRLEQSELVKLIDEGQLVYLPCKVGDTVYTIDEKCGDDWVSEINCGFCDVGVYDKNETCYKELAVRKSIVENPFDFITEIGKTVFLTAEEAEQSLKESEVKTQ